MEFTQDLVKGSIVPIVLALLKERPMYGYEIVKLVNARSGGRLEWKEGTLYPTLQRMLIHGWVTAEWRTTENKRRARYYTLTPEGRKQLAAEARDFNRAMTAIRRVIEPA